MDAKPVLQLTMWLSAVMAIFTASASAALTDGYWDVTSSGDGQTWDDTVLVFTSQMPDGPDFQLTGHFDWVGSGGSFGRENFRGTLYADLSLELIGFEIDPDYPFSPGRIGTAHYTAQLTPLGNEIVNGSWERPSTLSAVQVLPPRTVPTPGAILLTGFGTALVGWRKQRLFASVSS